MTGNCESQRGRELMNQCAADMFIYNTVVDKPLSSLLNLLFAVNEEHFQHNRRTGGTFSPIEVLLMRGSVEDINKLICYLRKPNSELPVFTAKSWFLNNLNDLYTIPITCTTE